uniref:Uncharacterized protein n=1 Tax=Corethron hystrix TaxID=216773 RepID=A0A7S1BMQ9_9STRA
MFDFLRRKKQEKEVPVVAEEEIGEDDGATPFFLSENEEESGEEKAEKAEEELDPNSPEALRLVADSLRKEATRMKLEAEKEDAQLTLSKIQSLEKQIADGAFDEDPKKADEAKEQIQFLVRRMEGDAAVAVPATPSASTTTITTTTSNSTSEAVEEAAEETLDFKNLFGKENQKDEEDPFYLMNFNPREMNRDNITDADLENYNRLWNDFPPFLRNLFARNMGFENADVITEINRTNVEIFFEDTPIDIFTDGNNTIIQRTEIQAIVESIFPRSMWKDGRTPALDDVDAFLTSCVNSTVFNQISKPEPVPGGFIVRGNNRMSSNDAMMTALTESLRNSRFHEELAVFYIDDPSPRDENMIEMGETNAPVLLVAKAPVAPRNNQAALALVSALGLLSAWVYSIGTFGYNDQVTQRIQEQQAANDLNLDWFLQLPVPAFVGILAITASNEIAQFIVAKAEKFKLYPPWLLPSFTLGTWGFITSLKSPPPNRQALFNFAFVGPFVGMTLSVILLVLGMSLTLSADRTLLPSLPVSLLRQSALAGGFVDYVYGGALGAPDPNSGLPLHPVAIVGFVGVLLSGYTSLPLGNTDGGRIVLSLFGRSAQSLISGLCLAVLCISGVVGGSDLALIYGLLVSLTQSDMEVPCLNEVDEVDTTSGVLAIIGFAVVALAVLPVPLDLPYL